MCLALVAHRALQPQVTWCTTEGIDFHSWGVLNRIDSCSRKVKLDARSVQKCPRVASAGVQHVLKYFQDTRKLRGRRSAHIRTWLFETLGGLAASRIIALPGLSERYFATTLPPSTPNEVDPSPLGGVLWFSPTPPPRRQTGFFETWEFFCKNVPARCARGKFFPYPTPLGEGVMITLHIVIFMRTQHQRKRCTCAVTSHISNDAELDTKREMTKTLTSMSTRVSLRACRNRGAQLRQRWGMELLNILYSADMRFQKIEK